MKKTALLTVAFTLILTGCAGTEADKATGLIPTETFDAEASKEVPQESAMEVSEEIPRESAPESSRKTLQEPTAEPDGTSNRASTTGNNQASGEPGRAETSLPPDDGSLTEAPMLTVSTQDNTDSVTASCGNWEWSLTLPDGMATTVIACGAHPLDQQNHPLLYTAFPAESLPPSENGANPGAMLPVFYLDFGDILPETVSALRWPASFIGNAQNHTEYEEVTVEYERNIIALVPFGDGDYVYEVSASWGETGSASYVFRTIPQVREEQEDKLAELIEALNGLEYQPYTCDGLPEYRLVSEDGTVYAINLSEKWVWRGNREQAELPDELAARLIEDPNLFAGFAAGCALRPAAD